MSQAPMTVPNGAPLLVRQGFNNALAALNSLNSGPSAPGDPVAFQIWVDTTSGQIKQRNAANTAWVALGSMLGDALVRHDAPQTLTSGQLAQARSNIGLGTSATYNIGVSGGAVPLLNAANTWSAAQTVHIPSLAAMVAPTAFLARNDYSQGFGSRWGGGFRSNILADGVAGVSVAFAAEDLTGENARATISGAAWGGTTKYWNFRLDTGNAHCVSGSWVNSSDPDLKEFDAPWADPVAMLFELNGREYTRLDTGARGVGLSAADVERIMPTQIYHNGPAYDEQGNLLTENARAIDTAGVGVAVLVEALKVAIRRIEALEAQLA